MRGQHYSKSLGLCSSWRSIAPHQTALEVTLMLNSAVGVSERQADQKTDMQNLLSR